MIDVLKTIISNMLTALYQPFWFALLLSILFMFVWKKYDSLKTAAIEWLRWFKTELLFRQIFFLVFYTVMILFRTLLNRSMWANPLSNVVGVWGIYTEKNGEMVLTTEVPENLFLFILYYFAAVDVSDKMLKEVFLPKVLWQSTKSIFFIFLHY